MTDPIDVSFRLNGVQREVSVEPRRSLGDVLHDDFEVRSVHLGCEQGACGGCMVLVDGEPANSCMLLAPQVDGRAVDTVEGLSETPSMQRLQDAFHQHHALQCGYCTPGMLVSLVGLVRDGTPVSADEVRERLRGNMCRCTGYQTIVAAALAATGSGEAGEP